MSFETPLPKHAHFFFNSFPKNQAINRSEKLCRLFGTYVLTFLLIGVTAGILFGLIELQNYLQDNLALGIAFLPSFVSIDVLLSACVAVVVVGMNAVWIPISAGLTSLERHHSWSSFRIHNAVKLVLFKLINATVLYLLVALRLRLPAAAIASGRCALSDAGSKFFLVLVVDIIFVNIISMILPRLKICCIRRCCRCCKRLQPKGGDEELRPEFDLAEEYLQILYRQFLLYLGTPAFPLIGVLGFLANLVEYPLDKFRMLRVCQEPKRIDDPMRGFLTVFFFIVGIAAALTYPNGPIWLLYRPTLTPVNYQVCQVFGFWRNLTRGLP